MTIRRWLTFLLAVLLPVSTALALDPGDIGDWWGRVTIDGILNDTGAVVDAVINNNIVATDIVGTPTPYYYLIHVPGQIGNNVTFNVCGIFAFGPTPWGTGNYELNLSVNTSNNGDACTYNCGCTSGICLHNVCRPTNPYCGDGYCEGGEDCSVCSADCGSCSTGGTGGGGGGSSGGIVTSTNTSTSISNTTCTPNWECSSWGECTNGIRTRTCTDLNSCGTESGSPPLEDECEATGTGTTGNESQANAIEGNRTLPPGAGITGMLTGGAETVALIGIIVVLAIILITIIIMRAGSSKSNNEEKINRSLNTENEKNYFDSSDC